jgi:hypothetical protein
MKQIKFCEMINNSNLDIVIVNRSKLGMASLLRFCRAEYSRITSSDRSSSTKWFEPVTEKYY